MKASFNPVNSSGTLPETFDVSNPNNPMKTPKKVPNIPQVTNKLAASRFDFPFFLIRLGS